MTPQEQKLIEDLASKVGQTQLGQKDADAESLIKRQIGSNPDSAYILVQTVLVQNMALEQAKAQIADLQQKLASAQQSQAPAPSSFLGGLFGSHLSKPAAPPPPPAAGYAPASAWQSAPPAYAPGPAMAPPGGGGFLRSAATTAAGVAAGALAFEGIESLLHGFGHHDAAGVGSSFLGQQAPGETIINNYYDSPQDQGYEADRAAGLGPEDSRDVETDADDQDTFNDASDDIDTSDYSDDGGSSDDSLV